MFLGAPHPKPPRALTDAFVYIHIHIKNMMYTVYQFLCFFLKGGDGDKVVGEGRGDGAMLY